MKIGVFSIYDNKAKLFSQPFFAINVSVAVRSFSGLANEAGNAVNKNPSDYTLFHVGTFDDDLGVFENCSRQENLGLAASFVKGLPEATVAEIVNLKTGS